MTLNGDFLDGGSAVVGIDAVIDAGRIERLQKRIGPLGLRPDTRYRPMSNQARPILYNPRW